MILADSATLGTNSAADAAIMAIAKSSMNVGRYNSHEASSSDASVKMPLPLDPMLGNNPRARSTVTNMC